MHRVWRGRSTVRPSVHRGIFHTTPKTRVQTGSLWQLYLLEMYRRQMIAIEIKVDELLIATSECRLIEDLHTIISAKYKVKLLGKPTKFIGRTVTNHYDWSIGLRKPNLVRTTIERSGMIARKNSHTVPLDDWNTPTNKFGGTTPAHDLQQPTNSRRYKVLYAWTRKYIIYVTGKWGAACHAPMQRHWVDQKVTN